MKVSKSALLWLCVLALGFGIGPIMAQINTINNGDFENAELPAYWQKEDANDAQVVWATDQFRSPERSLKISESGGADAPAWVSTNLAKLNWNRTTGIPKAAEMVIGGWVKTENVNTNPANADAEIQLTFSFYHNGVLIFGQPVVIKVPQTQASVNWTGIQNDVPVVLPDDADSLIIKFKFGANATGTAWLDDIVMKPAPGVTEWLGDIFNANFGVPAGWFFWKDRMSEGEADFGTVTITNTTAHRGSSSLLIADDPSNPAEVVAISDRDRIEPGRAYGLSAWLKLEGVNVNPKRDVDYAVFFTITYHNDDAGWAEIGGEDFFVVDQSAADHDWRLYEFTFIPPGGATRISIRPRLQHQAIGNTYWDDIRIYPVEIAKKNFSFDESLIPAYWSARNASNALVEWASDQYRSPERSLKINDADGNDEPMWVSGNLAKLQWNNTTGITKAVEMEVGGWVKTQGVNVNPADAANEIQLVYEFFDAGHNMIFGQPVVLKVPQAQSSVDWTEIKNDVPIVLPVDADSMVVIFKFGANATGTVWLDDIFMRNAPGASGWLGSLFNANFGVPEGWFFWKDHMDDGAADYGIVSVTGEHSHSGRYSLRVADDAANPAEVVGISDRNPVQPNTEYLVSAWVKLFHVNENPTKDVDQAIFFTVTYHGDQPGWDEKHGEDFFVINQTASDRDWALYSFRLKTREDDKRISIRARMQHQATGDTYWDDFQVVPIAQVMAGNGFENAELPAYWTKMNEADAELTWTGDVSRSPQRSLKISETSGADAPAWVTKANMAKLQWNMTTGIPPNIEMLIGGWVKTDGVNINPANADDEIRLVYTFYDKNKAVIFGQPVVLKVPQALPAVDWTEIKNDAPIVLPTDADSLSIQFAFGANATGTVYLDDIFMKPAPGASGWLGDLYNANFGVPEGWFFWKDQMSEGVPDKGVVSITRDAAHTGDYSLLISDDDTNPAEVVAISDRNPIAGDKLFTVEAWVKTDGVTINTTNDVEKSVFFTVTYHKDEPGWAEFRGEDFFVVDQSVASKDWSLYVFTLRTPPETNRMSIRARMQHQASGKTYWDDFAVAEGNITRVNGQEVKTVPVVFNLVQNYPNPFNPVTTVEFSLPNDDQVNLAIYDLLGKRIRTLIDGKYQAGDHRVVWDATDESGKSVSSGTYFYVLTTKNARMTRKMTLLK